MGRHFDCQELLGDAFQNPTLPEACKEMRKQLLATKEGAEVVQPRISLMPVCEDFPRTVMFWGPWAARGLELMGGTRFNETCSRLGAPSGRDAARSCEGL